MTNLTERRKLHISIVILILGIVGAVVILSLDVSPEPDWRQEMESVREARNQREGSVVGEEEIQDREKLPTLIPEVNTLRMEPIKVFDGRSDRVEPKFFLHDGWDTFMLLSSAYGEYVVYDATSKEEKRYSPEEIRGGPFAKKMSNKIVSFDVAADWGIYAVGPITIFDIEKGEVEKKLDSFDINNSYIFVGDELEHFYIVRLQSYTYPSPSEISRLNLETGMVEDTDTRISDLGTKIPGRAYSGCCGELMVIPGGIGDIVTSQTGMYAYKYSQQFRDANREGDRRYIEVKRGGEWVRLQVNPATQVFWAAFDPSRNSHLWFATSEGLFRYDFQNNTLAHAKEDTGLTSNYVYKFKFLKEGLIVLGHDWSTVSLYRVLPSSI
jgi:hypothetical protein